MTRDISIAVYRWITEKGLPPDIAIVVAEWLPEEFDDGAGADLREYDFGDLSHDFGEVAASRIKASDPNWRQYSNV